MASKCDRNGHNWGKQRGNWITCRTCAEVKHVNDSGESEDDPDQRGEDEWD